MKKLLRYLSPFAPDQSGACGVFYELGGLIVICDAGGCAGNICGFDEPRWFERKSAVFSAGLRDMDAIMGRDDKLIEKCRMAYGQLGGNFILLISTPVPAVIGTDLKALERLVSKKLGIPCIGIEATGTHNYDHGEEEAWFRLFQTFCTQKQDTVPGRLGIIGATPMESGTIRTGLLKKQAEAYVTQHLPFAKQFVLYSMDGSLEDIKNASSCEHNLVISAQGLKTAEYLREKFHIPYSVGFPFLPTNVVENAASFRRRKILILHSQFAANELKNRLDASNTVHCKTWFSFAPAYADASDGVLAGEDDFCALLEKENYDVVIADEEILPLLKVLSFEGEFVDYPEFAVSGRLLESADV